ncbi:protein PAXX isoform X1 [Poecile atricapillus]|uniref:protein PAXX isoform X1 n=1 Tax=Poecile atricapillus TaxID=48891 RepID=UPI0027396CA8|nr:protein PAXX isoform X1 [Poecile atricapillus]
MAELPGPALGRIRRSRPPFVPAPSTPLSDAVMEEPVGPFHLLRAETGRFLCYCGPDGTVFVTDAMEVWAGELGGCPVRGCRCSPEERGAMLRAALGHGAAALSLGPDSAMLRLPEEPRCPALALAQLPAAEARSQLQALIFGMAGCIESLERRLEVAVETLPSSCSPEKNTVRSQQLFLPDPSPRKSSASGSALPAKRKVHGESLINPGFKSKRAPSGVNFEDS